MKSYAVTVECDVTVHTIIEVEAESEEAALAAARRIAAAGQIDWDPLYEAIAQDGLDLNRDDLVKRVDFVEEIDG